MEPLDRPPLRHLSAGKAVVALYRRLFLTHLQEAFDAGQLRFFGELWSLARRPCSLPGCGRCAPSGNQMAGTIATLASRRYVADAARLRAARHRYQAAQLLKMAADESVAGLRHRLVDPAHDYHQLAATLEDT